MMSKFSIPWPTFLLACAGPASVLACHEIAGHLGIRRLFDHPFHFSGGFTISILIYTLLRIASPWLGELSQPARYLLTFCAACTVAVFWEFGEFASDVFRGTHDQQSDMDTMLDLVFGTLGSLSMLLVTVILRRSRQPALA